MTRKLWSIQGCAHHQNVDYGDGDGDGDGGDGDGGDGGDGNGAGYGGAGDGVGGGDNDHRLLVLRQDLQSCPQQGDGTQD